MVYDAGIARVRQVKTPNIATRRTIAGLLARSAGAELALHQNIEAGRRIDASMQLLGQTGDYPAPKVELAGEAYFALEARADFEAASGSVGQAAATWNDLLARVNAANPDPQNILRDAVYISHVWDELAQVLRRSGEAKEARTWNAKRLKLWEHWERKLPNNRFVQHKSALAQEAAADHHLQ